MTNNSDKCDNDDNNLTLHNLNYNPYSMFFYPVTASEVYNIIRSLKNSKYSGYDDINSEVLKLCAGWICHPLSHIINLSFLGGKYPDQLKMAVVKPLFNYLS